MTSRDRRDAVNEELRDEVAGVLIAKLVNVTNLPEWMQVPALGRPMRPLANMLAAALMPLLERREREAAAAERERIAREFETDAARAWGGDAPWLTTGQKVADLAAEWARADATTEEAR